MSQETHMIEMSTERLLELLELAKKVAIQAHADKLDDGGEPYWKHPEAVAARMTSLEGKMAAWLHDVVEDTPITIEDLRRMGFPSLVLDAVYAVTRQIRHGQKEKYIAEFIPRIKRSGPLAVELKLADLDHNMSPERVAKLPPEKQDIVRRYERAKRILEG
jgi:(p)ppGpp synthase/HD superfamily hydrolase